MPYRVRPNGTIECDSAEEAVKLQALIAGKHGCFQPAPPKERSEPDKRSRQPDYIGYWEELNSVGRTMLTVLSAEARPISAKALADKSGLSTKDLPSKMIHVRRAARRCALPQPIVRTIDIEGGRKTGFYRLSKEVRERLTPQITEWKKSRG